MSISPLAIEVTMNVAARRPLVRLHVGTGEAVMTPDEARVFGQQLLGAATEAEIQGFLLDWFTKHTGPMTTEQAVALAMQFRQYVAAIKKRGRDDRGPDEQRPRC